MSPEQVVTEYLALTTQCHPTVRDGYGYTCPADWLLTHGRFWTPPTTPPRYRMTPQACFDNAYKLAVRSRGRLRYAEGIALAIIPVDHAWCVDA
jgi:hypothetical protein